MEANEQKTKTLKGSMKFFKDDRLEFTPYDRESRCMPRSGRPAMARS